MPAITRHFLGWDRPLVELAGERLITRGSERLLDLSHLLVIVPTRNSGRRLREMLAQLANTRGRALIPPRVAPPEYLLSLISEPDEATTASPEESLLAWIRVLQKADLQKFRALFPVAPIAQDFGWARGTAAGLIELRQTLGEAGLDIGDVVELFGDQLEEEDRWIELTRLEKAYQQLLARLELADLQTTRKHRADSPDFPPDEIREIIVAGVPDPIPLAIQVLFALSGEIPVEVHVYAPENLADSFDRWGRPRIDVWKHRRIEFPDFDREIQVLPNALAQADRVAERVRAYQRPSESIAIGVLDEEIAPAIKSRLETAGVLAFNPEGESLQATGPVYLLGALRDLLRDRSYEAFLELLRCPDYTAYLANNIIFWDTPQAFRQFDKLYQLHLPRDLTGLRRFTQRGRAEITVEQMTALNDTEQLLKDLEKRSLAVTFPDVIHQILTSRNPAAGGKTEGVLRAVSERLKLVLDAAAGPVGKPLKLTSADQLDLAIQFLESERLYDEREPGAVELLGWLELLWDDSPHLVAAGFNDGFVPDSIVGDPFLPEQLRKSLAQRVDFQTNDRRFARDAYLLAALLNWRRATGRVELLLGKRTQSGDPLRPSRLLFACADEELPARAQKLFAEAAETEENLAWSPGFLLQPRGAKDREPVIDSIGVTSFRTYLKSPLHFYLTKIEYMRAIDGDKLEMDAMDFGNFVHAVLHRFANQAAIRDSTDERAIRAFLLSEAEKVEHEWYGDNPPLPVRFQLHSARQRLSAAARVQAADRAAGWKIERAEFQLGDGVFKLADVFIKGQVDRLDRHERTGQLRVLDYKTGETAESPAKAHATKVTSATNRDWLPDYAQFETDKGPHRWLDLQLPLYRLGLGEPGAICGYFNLPKAAADTGIQLWDGLSSEHDDAARRCAEGIIFDVQAGRFWPYHVDNRKDDFCSLHLSIPERTIDRTPLQPAAAESGADPEIAHGIDGAGWSVGRVLVMSGDFLEPGEEIVELRNGARICVLQATREGIVDEISVRPGEPVIPNETVILRVRSPDHR